MLPFLTPITSDKTSPFPDCFEFVCHGISRDFIFILLESSDALLLKGGSGYQIIVQGKALKMGKLK